MPPTQGSTRHRRLAAILFADVQGYSRLMGEDEEAAHRKTAAFIEIFRKQVKGYSGRIVQTRGDGVLAEFNSALNAVRFAVDIQKAVLEKNLDTPIDRRVEFRVGINLGDVIGGRLPGKGTDARRSEGLGRDGGGGNLPC